MKRLLVLLALVAAVGAASYYVCYQHVMKTVVAPGEANAEMAWLKTEFALTPAQSEKVAALHEAYRPICAGHCERFAAAHGRLSRALEKQTSWSEETAQLFDEVARIESECHASMLKHAYDVAACMSPEQGRRYLEMIKLQISRGDPSGMFAAVR